MPLFPARCRRLLLATACLLAAPLLPAAEFSVTPIRADLKPGAMNETITVANHSDVPLRVSVKLMAWTQDAAGKDVYEDSSDLVYFPRQMDVPPGAKRLVRIGARAPGGATERSWRLFIEEQPEAAAGPGASQVRFYFRFGVPVFLAPAAPQPLPDVGQPVLADGKLSLQVRNAGNQHFRLQRLLVSDGTDWKHEIAGWYSLAGAQRTYTADVPAQVCRRAQALQVTLEGEGVKIDRKIDVDPARCS